MTELHLYLKNGLYYYKVDGGEMCCPPYVKGRDSARMFFGSEYILHFTGEEQRQERKADHIMEWPRVEKPKKPKDKAVRPRREKKKPRGVMGRPRRAIAQYGLDGSFIRVWEDCNAAAQSLECSRSGISKCCHGETKSSCGYIWRLVVNGEYPESVGRHRVERSAIGNRAKMVICRDLKGKIIGEYKSTIEASRAVGMSARMVRYYCNSGMPTRDGKIWQYKSK